ncbi:DUF3784 domain-containing protein [Bacillus sp. AK128]
MMDQAFIATTLILLTLAYFVGVKKQTWLLSGFNQKRVREQEKLSKIVGTYNLIMGIAMFIGIFIDHPDRQVLFPILVIGYVILIGYVNTKMVE